MFILESLKGLAKALFFMALVLNVGCVGAPPKIDQAKAVEAQKYAKRNYAMKYAASYYRKGSLYLKKAHEYYEDRLYTKAQKAYEMARIYFEKSETKARISQIKQGGDF